MPGVDWSQIVDVAMVAREVLDDVGLVGWPKTSGSRGPPHPRADRAAVGLPQVRLAAETLAREVENRAPGLATARWWKEERGESVFVDFNQNAKDRTVASAYSIRPLPDARVSTPLDWDEVRVRRPEEFTVATVLERFAEIGDPHEGIDDAVGTLDGLLALAKELGPAEKPPRGERLGRRAPAVDDAAHRDRAHEDQARGARGARAVEGAASCRGRACCIPPTCSSTACAARARSGTACAINLQHVPEAERPQQERAARRLRPVGRQDLAGAASRSLSQAVQPRSAVERSASTRSTSP